MKTKIITTVIVIIVIASCKKEGTGGDATVATIVQHHSKKIPFATVYVKYGAKEFPGADVSKYDANQKTDKEGHTHFEVLQKGDYYFYGVGYDSAISAVVVGGVPLTIKRKERKSEIELNVPVTED